MNLQKINSITPASSDFLQIITSIAKSPKSLYFMGEIPAKRRPTVAIVGSRKATSYGHDVGYRLAYELASNGIVIVSGLAIGMDAIAHTAALDAGGTTLAVLANGLPQIYPSQHTQLARRILEQHGAIISEYEPGQHAMRHQFLERNRIVSGLSDVVLIVEAAARSGTLATANFALDQGRDVAAVPGNITSPMSAGCNQLIRHGAMPITSTSDILELLGIEKESAQASLPLAASPEEAIVLQLLSTGVQSGDELLQRSKLDSSLFAQTLSMLEISGKIRPLGTNNWSLK